MSNRTRTVTLRFTPSPEDQALYAALVEAGKPHRSSSSMAHWLLQIGLGFRFADQRTLERMYGGTQWRAKLYEQYEVSDDGFCLPRPLPLPKLGKPTFRLVLRRERSSKNATSKRKPLSAKRQAA